MSERCLAAILALFSIGCGAAQTAVSDKPETPFKLATGADSASFSEKRVWTSARRTAPRSRGGASRARDSEIVGTHRRLRSGETAPLPDGELLQWQNRRPGFRQGPELGQDRGAHPVSLAIATREPTDT